MIEVGSLFVIKTPRGKQYVKKLLPNWEWQSHDGLLTAEQITNANFGDILYTNLGMPVRISEATLEDRMLGIKRLTQIIYPKDAAYICLRLGVGQNRIIGECGCGSGGLTLVFSWFGGNNCKIISQDNREEFLKLTAKNLEWANLGQNVVLHHQDLTDGFCVNNADALFVDVREPWKYLKQIENSSKPGATIGFLIPTVNQASELLAKLENAPFDEIEMLEIFMRKWKTLPDRLRPNDRMIAHTSFLIFCRKCQINDDFEKAKPIGTREIKQLAASMRRKGEEIPPQTLD